MVPVPPPVGQAKLLIAIMLASSYCAMVVRFVIDPGSYQSLHMFFITVTGTLVLPNIRALLGMPEGKITTTVLDFLRRFFRP